MFYFYCQRPTIRPFRPAFKGGPWNLIQTHHVSIAEKQIPSYLLDSKTRR